MEFIKSFIRKIVAIVKFGAEMALQIVAGPVVEIYNTKTVTHWNIAGIIARIVFFASFITTLPAIVVGLAAWYMGWVISMYQICFYIAMFGIIISNEDIAIDTAPFKFDFKKAASDVMPATGATEAV